MPVRVIDASPERDPLRLDPTCVEVGSVPWLLAAHRDALLSNSLTAAWRGSVSSGRKAGRAAWPAPVLLSLLVLRWSDGGVSRLGACRRARTDLAWRAAMGLPIGQGGAPTEKTMREFEGWLMQPTEGAEQPRYQRIHESIVEHLRALIDRPVWAMDSSPMLCFGALRGTFRMLADGLRSLVRRLLRVLSNPAPIVQATAGIVWLTSKSAKGGQDIDWRSEDDRNRAVDDVARTVLRIVDLVRPLLTRLSPAQRRNARKRCDDLVRVIESDLERDENGRYKVARKVAKDRIVSITDPEARSGRKTRSQPYKGFKFHVLGDVASRVIAAVDVASAGAAESAVGHELIRRARETRPDIDQVLADTAYGSTETRVSLEQEGVDLLAPPHGVLASKSDRLRKHDFSIDFEADTATCPNGVMTSDRRSRGERTTFVWPLSACATCPVAERCLSPKQLQAPAGLGPKRRKGRTLQLHPNEEALRAARAAWEDSERRQAYRRRSEVELMIANMVRHGARKARSFGMEAAKLQVHAIAIRCNLELLARELGRTIQGSQPAKLSFPERC